MKKKNIVTEKDANKINKIIFGKKDVQYSYGVAHFSDLGIDQLEELLKNEYIKPRSSHNFSNITVAQFRDFMKKYDGFTLNGFVYRKARRCTKDGDSISEWDELAIAIEGIEAKEEIASSASKKCIYDFVMLCRRADDFTINEKRIYAWWD
jgi:hypothetical protein